MFRRRIDGGFKKRALRRRTSAPAVSAASNPNVLNVDDDDNDDFSSSSRDSRVKRRARQILQEEAEAQQLADVFRTTNRGREKDCCDRSSNCRWNDTAWMRPMCITPLYSTPLYTPAQTFVSSSVDTVCNIAGGCYTITQPIATTCTPFGCASLSIAPPNLAAVRDVGYGVTTVGAACSMF